MRRYVGKDFRPAKADPRIDPIGNDAASAFFVRTFEESGDATVGIETDHAVRSGALVEKEGGQGIALAMEIEHGGEVVIGDDVAVLDKEGIALAEERLHVLDAARRSEEFFLNNIGQADTHGCAIGEIVADGGRQEMEVNGDVIEMMVVQMRKYVLQDRASV